VKLSWFLIGPLLTLLVLACFERLIPTRYYLPDPAPLALAAVAFSGFAGGLRSALLSALLALAYGFHFYSNPYAPGQLLHLTQDNLRRFLLLLVTTPTVAVMSGLRNRPAEWKSQADRSAAGTR
jgi:hypothetical protein